MMDKMKMKKLDLVVVGENFGLSYSGGSTATALLIKEMLSGFNSVTVICQNNDGFLEGQIKFISYEILSEIPEMLRKFSKEKTVLYGDFHVSYIVADSDFPFYFTYHDNYPEFAAFVDNKEHVASIIGRYKKIFNAANMVFSVSDYKIPFISESTDKVMLIRNGLSQNFTKNKVEKYDGNVFKILMVGNIDYRKYGKAIELFKALKPLNLPIKIDVFGNINEEEIFKQICQFDFVDYKGFKEEINHMGYHLMLQTSVIENLSLSAVDAFANFTPILSFDVGGIREVIKENNGRIIEPFDINKMALTLQQLVLDFPEFSFETENLSAFSWAKSAKKMMEVMYQDHSLF